VFPLYRLVYRFRICVLFRCKNSIASKLEPKIVISLYSEHLIYGLYMCTCVFFLHQESFDMILVNTHHFMIGVLQGVTSTPNPILRCFINPEVLNYGDLLVGVVYELVELANGLRLSTEVLSQDLSGARVIVRW
jgi:hypothetical protein